MPLYSYKAVNPDGRTVLGRIDAVNLVDLDMRLRRMELDLVRGAPVGNRRLFAGDRVPRQELIHFCFHLQQLVRAGVPVLEGLSDLRDSVDQPRFREVVASLIEAIEGGQTLSQAMEAHQRVFDGIFVSLVRAGETSGRLPEVLKSLHESLRWEDELAAQTKKMIAYPAFVGTVVLAATAFLMIYMVPQLKLFVKNMGQTLPAQTQVLFFVSDLLAGYWYALLLVLALAILALRLVLQKNPHARYHFDHILLELPLVGQIQRKIILSRFANTFALLFASGIPIIESIRATQGVVGNLVIRKGLERVEQLIGEGNNVTGAFQQTGFFPPLVIRMLRVGENTGALDEALANVSYFYTRDVHESVQRIQQLIEPMLTVVMGCLLGWIMLSVLGPVYEVISRIRP
ncbi:MAG: type II secretion system F family protein [Candidatus Accumulibacter sp.]|uniref:type II secretion system F family protein n=1 Tax=Accumulibacter sp. TaxID=2053492 RepID=UPI00287834CD|nr:type II secretion system F family protein [Accumulibacter sp.]MDS4016261.1 type II secretion system F family protein [Accumulibacter sp.]